MKDICRKCLQTTQRCLFFCIRYTITASGCIPAKSARTPRNQRDRGVPKNRARGRNTEKGGAGGDKFILASEARVITPPLPPPRRYNDWSRDTLNGETGGDTVPWTGEKGGGGLNEWPSLILCCGRSRLTPEAGIACLSGESRTTICDSGNCGLYHMIP